MQIAFIGGGAMAEAMIACTVAQGYQDAKLITVAEPIASRREELSKAHSVSVVPSNLMAVQGATLIILSIKPQQLKAVLTELHDQLIHSQFVISIVAGARLATLTKGLNHQNVIRVMPNTPARIGSGISIWTSSTTLDEETQKQIVNLLEAMGKQIYVDNEKYLDMATAVSGSGPAYVFAFMEAIVDAATSLGLPLDLAQTLTVETVLGSSLLARNNSQQLDQLREMVTSPGGTTAAALLKLEEGEFRSVIGKAVIAAHEKALSLGKDT